MFWNYFSAAFYMPLIIVCMIISQLYLERHQDIQSSRDKKRNHIRVNIIVLYLLQELCLIQLSLWNLHDFLFTMFIPITMLFRKKYKLWWYLLAITPFYVYTVDYFNQNISLGNWLVWIPITLINLLICGILYNWQWGKVGNRLVLAIVISVAAHVALEILFVQGQVIFQHLAEALVGTIAFLIFESLRWRSEEKNQRWLSDLKLESERDGLTGLLNYRSFNQEISRVSRKKNIKTILIGVLDIDHFKHINDTYGHLNGNDVLSSFSDNLRIRLHKTFPHEAYIYRFGGEEFTVVVLNHDIETVRKFFQEMEDYFQKKSIETRDGYHVKISFSCSLTMHIPGEKLEHTLERADNMLYQVKNNSRGWIIIREDQQGPIT